MNTDADWNSIAEKTAKISLLLIAAWLVLASLHVSVDNDDGFFNILNSQYFIGHHESYSFQRGPLLGMLLVPGALLVNFFDLEALDARPYHFVAAFYVAIYLAAVWFLLKRVCPDRMSAAIGFFAAVYSVIFFSYAPFLNVDILPGGILLAMLYFCERQRAKPCTSNIVLLVLLGFAAVSFKVTYALFWISIIVVELLLVFRNYRSPTAATQFRHLIHLTGAAACSAILAWLLYAFVLRAYTEYLSSPHPLLNLFYLATSTFERYSEDYLAANFPYWLYVRNFPAYGILVSLLILPGLVVGICSKNAFLQRLCLVWIVCFLANNLISYREVRYLAFLAPLTAVIIAHTVFFFFKSIRWFKYVLLIPLIFDVSFAAAEAIRIFHPFYASGQQDFLQFSRFERTVKRVVTSESLSFVAPFDSRLYADRYHRIFNLTGFAQLFADSDREFITLPIEGSRGLSYQNLLPDSLIWLTYGILHRRSPWSENNRPTGINDFFQFAATTERIVLTRDQDRFYLPTDEKEGYPIMLLKSSAIADEVLPVVSYNYFTKDALEQLFGEIPENATMLSLIGLRVHYICDSYYCGEPGAENNQQIR